jgi:hypothetical protein
MSSSKPHLHDPHCRISSVVPVKLPLILPEYLELKVLLAPLICTPVIPVVWFAVVLSGRGSQEEYRTWAEQVESLGRADPGGRVEKCAPFALTAVGPERETATQLITMMIALLAATRIAKAVLLLASECGDRITTYFFRFD